jgi:membrane-associated phospholipid phosphatase
LIFLLLALLAPAVTARAQVEEDPATQQQPNEQDPPRSSDPGKQAFVKTFLKDEARIWTSPFRRSSYSSHAFPKYVLPFTLITGALLATDHRTANLLPNSTEQATWSRRVSQVGASYTLAGMAATMYLVSRATHNQKAREVGFLGVEAIAHTQIVTLVFKTATQRERPLDFEANHSGGIAFGKGGDSFPSGHASSSFALATVFAYEYGREHRWVPYASYGLASVVAASRLSAQKHWMSDIFVGSAMGFMIGRYVYKAHHDPRVDGDTSKRADRLVPQFGMTAHGATVAWNW